MLKITEVMDVIASLLLYSHFTVFSRISHSINFHSLKVRVLNQKTTINLQEIISVFVSKVPYTNFCVHVPERQTKKTNYFS